MGQELVLFEEEYWTGQDVGCCAMPGAGVTLRVQGDTQNLKDFAYKNQCQFTEHISIANTLASANIKASLPAGDFATLSCRQSAWP